MVGQEHDGRLFLYRFVTRILTEPESMYFWGRFGPLHSIRERLDDASQYLAGRFAAKEAMRKACDHLKHSSRGFKSIMVLPIRSTDRKSGQNDHLSAAPQGLILDAPYEALEKSDCEEEQGILGVGASPPLTNMDGLHGQLCPISISHDGDFATAVAIVPHMEPRQAEDIEPPSGVYAPEKQLSEQVLGKRYDATQEDGLSPQPILQKTLRPGDERLIQQRMQDVQRRKHLVDQIEKLREMERAARTREEKLFVESTPKEKLRWRRLYSDAGLSAPQEGTK
ncbi:hypothetical protein FB567DRAFT_455373 [Paraphoma chrysanthemicola]|uniref:4'-phosphopantetheinyl transferase domain-containing protein n=1 Tax=Paraphoma chrysanthemicola TaxID=798071 RepID=A0A8K0QVC4_9PLEO|nr:hypothetical protein FB567DRAFT_455373 [Paraphoma chrysanthemicola]